MTRPQVIDPFTDKVINHLGTQPNRGDTCNKIKAGCEWDEYFLRSKD
jgi:hypothetical protein